MTGAGTSWSIASWTVQRPSPESATQPLRWVEVLAVRPERAAGELQQPRPDDRAVASTARRSPRGRARSRRVHDLEALGVGLHQAVLDPVVDHLHVVPGAGAADVEVAALRGERREDRLERLHRARRSPPTIRQ